MKPPDLMQSKLIQAWLAPYTAHTQRTYQTDWHRFQKTVQEPLKAVTALDLQRFQDTLHHLHVRSQIRIMATLSSLFKFAYQEEFITKDPTRNLPIRKLPPLTEPQVLSDDQLAQLQVAASSLRNQVLLNLMCETGLTVGEVCRLHWHQIHLDNHPAAWLTFESPEGPIRQLPLSAQLTVLLQTLKEHQKASDFVFTSARSSPLHSSQVFRIIQELGRKAKLPHNISPSCLRHTYAHRALANGMPILDLQHRLGHMSLPPTLRYLLPSTGHSPTSPPQRHVPKR